MAEVLLALKTERVGGEDELARQSGELNRHPTALDLAPRRSVLVVDNADHRSICSSAAAWIGIPLRIAVLVATLIAVIGVLARERL